MQARRAARELALILCSQLDKKISSYAEEDFENIILHSVRTLTNNASEELKIVVADLFQIKEQIIDYEAEHEDNLKRPIGASNIVVPVILSSDFITKIDKLINISEKSLAAIEIAEMTTLQGQNEVKEYVLCILKTYQKNNEAIDDEIKKFAVGWNIDRLVRIDKDILRIAICELLYMKDAPVKVVIDEAIEMAKKYSTEDSSSFVNGILGKIVESNSINK